MLILISELTSDCTRRPQDPELRISGKNKRLRDFRYKLELMMEKLKLKLWDFLAFGVTVAAFVFQILGYFLPKWWTYNDPVARHTIELSMLGSQEIEGQLIDNKSVIEIEGGREWLFISRAFGMFGNLLNFLAVICHIQYIPFRHDTARSASIYLLGASSLFILGGSIVFVALHPQLATNLKPEYGTLEAPWGVCILAGLVTIAASILTAVATIKKANQFDFDDDEDLDFSEVQMRHR